MTDRKLSIDEERRTRQHEEVKSRVEREVNSEVVAMADTRAPTEAAVVERMASGLRAKAVREVVETEREIDTARGAARTSQILDYVFYVVYGLLSIRLVLELLNANEGAGFVRFIVAITQPLYAPFRGIFPNLTAQSGGYTFVASLAFAIAMYVLLHLLLRELLRMMAHRRTEV